MIKKQERKENPNKTYERPGETEIIVGNKRQLFG